VWEQRGGGNRAVLLPDCRLNVGSLKIEVLLQGEFDGAIQGQCQRLGFVLLLGDGYSWYTSSEEQYCGRDEDWGDQLPAAMGGCRDHYQTPLLTIWSVK
jgi:hypothetical protein